MKNIQYKIINPVNLSGNITVPPSKSDCHRAVICAGLSEGVSEIENITFSEDIEATCQAMKHLGINIVKFKDGLIVKGKNKLSAKESSIHCCQSGSTLRFLIPLAATLGEEVTFEGEGKLVERPLKPYYDIFNSQKLQYKNQDGKLPLTVNGVLKSGEYKVKGNISSQFISGLLFALPLLEGDSKIVITTELESKPYVDMTLDMLNKFSIKIENNNYKEFIIKGNQKYKSCNHRVEGDFSQAAFLLTIGILGEGIKCRGLNVKSLQGDKAILDILRSMGAQIIEDEEEIEVLPSKTQGTVIDASQCPDLVPVLAALASVSEGNTEIVNAARLRIKESDRLAAISSELNKIGADVEEKEDGLTIRGKDKLRGGETYSWNDHRIAMALASISSKCTEPLIIKDSNCVKKSYPEFWQHFRKLGGNIDEWSVGEQY